MRSNSSMSFCGKPIAQLQYGFRYVVNYNIPYFKTTDYFIATGTLLIS